MDLQTVQDVMNRIESLRDERSDLCSEKKRLLLGNAKIFIKITEKMSSLLEILEEKIEGADG